MCFSGSGPAHFFRSWVRIGIGPTHFLSWIVYYCVRHDIDKSQISFIELRKIFRTNSGLRAISSCLHLFWPQLCNRNICAVSYVCACFVTAEFKIFISPADCGVWTHPHFYRDLRPCHPMYSSGSWSVLVAQTELNWTLAEYTFPRRVQNYAI